MPKDEDQNAAAILRDTGVEVHDDEFALLSIEKHRWPDLLRNQNAGPGAESVFMIFSDPFEVTLLLNRKDLQPVLDTITEARVERGFRLLTFTTPMSFDVVGFLAAVTRILADAGIPVVAASSFSRDHLLIKQDDLAAALKVLGPFVDKLC